MEIEQDKKWEMACVRKRVNEKDGGKKQKEKKCSYVERSPGSGKLNKSKRKSKSGKNLS